MRWKAVSKQAICGRSGRSSRIGSDRREAARLVQRREGCQLLQRLHHLAGQPDRRGEVSPAMHYPVTDRDQGVRVEIPLHPVQQFIQHPVIRGRSVRPPPLR